MNDRLFRSRRKDDHGTFRIAMSPEQENALIQQGIAQAQKNPVRPGHQWFQFVGEEDGVRRAVLGYHVDLHQKIVEVVETWDGVETGRRTYELEDVPS